MSGARSRLFAYGPADATAVPKPRHLLPHLNPDWIYHFWYRFTQVVCGCPSGAWYRLLAYGLANAVVCVLRLFDFAVNH